MVNSRIDLNLDAGESDAAFADGTEAALYDLVSSVNVACGGHAGDRSTMLRSVRIGRERGLRIGAHPSYPDRQNFGRTQLNMSHMALVDSLRAQIESLAEVCVGEGVRMAHVKPHGALYNVAAVDKAAAEAVFEAVRRVDPSLMIVGLAGSDFLKWCADAELVPVAEAFCDRRYEADGRLRARNYADALITNPDEAADQALRIVVDGYVIARDGQRAPVVAQTFCVHGDSVNAVDVAKAVRARLEAAGVRIG